MRGATTVVVGAFASHGLSYSSTTSNSVPAAFLDGQLAVGSAATSSSPSTPMPIHHLPALSPN
jgi:hypothetical protein